MPNDSGLTGWVIAKNRRTGLRFPALMHPEENEFISMPWNQVPEDVLNKWASEGLPEALFVLGEKSLNKCDFKTAFSMFSRGAKQNDMNCMFYLGTMHAQGLGIIEDMQKALSWYEQAANLGHRESQYNLAQHYLMGDNVPQNVETAIYWYECAALQGDADANYNLGIIFFLGDSVRRDIGRALKHFKAAVSLGNVKAEQYISIIESS